MGETGNGSGKTFGISNKLLYIAISSALFLVLALTKTVEFTPDQVMTFILGIAGLGITGHAITDVASMFKRPALTAVIEELAAPVKPISETEEKEDESGTD